MPLNSHSFELIPQMSSGLLVKLMLSPAGALMLERGNSLSAEKEMSHCDSVWLCDVPRPEQQASAKADVQDEFSALCD